MRKYGEIPKDLGQFHVNCSEMLFYQYMPIKIAGSNVLEVEVRLKCFNELISVCIADFATEFGIERLMDSYVYISAKNLFQPVGVSYNRPGWHSDGFLTDDINYVWSDLFPTVFNKSKFDITLDDELSLKEMEAQADPANNFTFPENTLLRLDQFNIHRVAEVTKPAIRTFLKVSISKDQYNLEFNTHNHALDYNWTMFARKVERNIPQNKI